MSDSRASRRDELLSLSVWEEIDDICDRFEEAWNAEEPPRVEDYLVADWPTEQTRVLVRELLIVDLDQRRAMGQEPSVSEYHQSFSSYYSEVEQAFAASLEIEPSTREHQPEDRNRKSSRRIGPYKLLQQIGEGGMGSVWMADQEEPVLRRVALKLIKSGHVDKQVIARFEAERQALAMMDHQHIAHVLDAGTAEDGTPYFVMELVQGDPITKYCDRNKLTPRERLQLFVPICEAVQHAHQKGIIHRDLKPSNVLVQMHDGKPMAKVIDFGLAKALQHQTKLTDKTVFTEFGQVVGTVQYMSPEQARLDAIDVDTRTDIYSLGVMLYELLAGSTPIDQEMLKEHALLQVLEIIQEKEPPRPSHRLSTSGQEKLQAVSERRQIQPAKLQQILRGDLDWIVMKALEKDRSRRYKTANAFAEDIGRYLEGEAVEARPPTTAYRVRKLVRKNVAQLATAATVSALLITVIILVVSSNLISQRRKALQQLILSGVVIDIKERSATFDSYPPNFRELIPALRNCSVSKLYIRGGLSSLEQLRGLQDLELLSLNGCSNFGDLAPIWKWKELRSLDVSKSSVSDLAPLSRLRRLETLVCADTAVNDASPLQNLPLVELDIRGTSISKLGSLAHLRKLVHLYVDRTPIETLDFSESLASLSSLSVRNCLLLQSITLVDLESLASAVVTGNVRLQHAKLQRVGELTKLQLRDNPAMKTVSVINAPKVSTVVAVNCPQLGKIELRGSFDQLERIEIDATGVVEIADILRIAESKQKLSFVSLSNTKIRESQLTRLKELVRVDEGRNVAAVPISVIDLFGKPIRDIPVWLDHSVLKTDEHGRVRFSIPDTLYGSACLRINVTPDSDDRIDMRFIGRVSKIMWSPSRPISSGRTFTMWQQGDVNTLADTIIEIVE